MNMNSIQVVFFDFGGVLAEEGYRQGLQTIAMQNGLEPDSFFKTATDTIYECGYVIGRSTEQDYWNLMRARTGIKGSDQELTGEILSRFTLRPAMFDAVRKLNERNITTAILSDQTDWLDRLESQYRFFGLFDRVINSYHFGKTKRDDSIFTDAVSAYTIKPSAALFVDDNSGNTERAEGQGLVAHLFVDEENFFAALAPLLR
jgi:putative hydrolase of the HAD superfamily